MRKIIFAAATALLMGVQPGAAASDGTYFQRALTVYSATSSCDETIGLSYKSTLRPGGLDNNSATESFVSMAWGRGAASIILPEGKKKGTYGVTGVSSRGQPFSFGTAGPVGTPGPKFKLLTQPKTIKDDTGSVLLTIRLTDMWGTPGCTMVLKGAYIAQP